MIGQPLCSGCYDYHAHALWHAHAGELWNRTCRAIRRRLATAAGIGQAALNEHLRVSFAKVVEYQRRSRFEFCSSPWTLGQVKHARVHDSAAGVSGRDTGGRLTIERAEIRTRTGMYAVHLVPVLVLPVG
ncbi:hypothetical protein BGM09_09235 [Streptomyces sp. CBMA29]|nr:hypothetical protein [Streptomyces sp. CBMA29]